MDLPSDLQERFDVDGAPREGASGHIWKASERTSGRKGWLKVLSSAVAGSASERQRLKRELTKQATLFHENLALPIATGDTGSTLWLFREDVDGETLRDRLGRGALPSSEAIAIAAQLSGALDELHRAGLLFRDLKPEHIVLQKGGRVVAFDAGIAAPFEHDEVFDLFGTPAYLSPEQAKGKLVSFRSDLYALGCVLFEAATGKPPFEGDTGTVLDAHMVDEAPPPPDSLPQPVQALITQLLDKRPRNRPTSAGAVHKALDPFLPEALRSSGEPVDPRRTLPGMPLTASAPPPPPSMAPPQPPSMAPEPEPEPEPEPAAEPERKAGTTPRNPDKTQQVHLSDIIEEATAPRPSSAPPPPPSSVRPSKAPVVPAAASNPPRASAPPSVRPSAPPPSPSQAPPSQSGAPSAPPPSQSEALSAPPPSQSEAPSAPPPSQSGAPSAPPPAASVPPADPNPGKKSPDKTQPLDAMQIVDEEESAPVVAAAAAPAAAAPVAAVAEPEQKSGKGGLYFMAGAAMFMVGAIVLVGFWMNKDEGTPVANLGNQGTTTNAQPANPNAPVVAPGTNATGSAAQAAQDQANGVGAPVNPVVEEPGSEDQTAAAEALAAEALLAEAAAAEPAAAEAAAAEAAAAEAAAAEAAAAEAAAAASAMTSMESASMSTRSTMRSTMSTMSAMGGGSAFDQAREAARAAFQRGDAAGAEQAYLRATSINPRHAGSWAGLGAARTRQGNHNGAVQAYQRAVTLSPRSSGFFTSLGHALRSSGNANGARQAYQRALALNPNNQSAQRSLQSL